MLVTKLHKCLLLFILFLLSACSGGSCQVSTNSNTVSGTIEIVAPKIIYSKGSVGSGYVVIVNPFDATISDINYSLTNSVGSGVNATIDPLSATQCSSIASHASCNLKINIPANSVAGSFAVTASNGNIIAKSTTNNMHVVGIEEATTNNLQGADGIILSYFDTIIDNTPYLLISGLVASNNAGSFNNIVLVDGNNNPLPNQQLIGGNTSYSQGDTFSILLKVPSGNNLSQTIKVQTQQISNTGGVTIVSTASTSGTFITKSNIGIAEMLPQNIYLTESNPEQIITFTNIGDVTATLQELVTNNSNIDVVFSPGALGVKDTMTATLSLKNVFQTAQNSAITLTYNNSQDVVSTTGNVEQKTNPAPDPDPEAGLLITVNPDNDFYTTTIVGTVSRELTITNTGNTVESGFVLELPANFTISNGSTNSCIITNSTGNATISDSLISNTSCNLTLVYTNNTYTAQATATINIAFNYADGVPVSSPISQVVNYRVTQSTANLSLTPTVTQNYGSIPNDNTTLGSQIAYTLTNSGETTATNLGFNFSGTGASLFSVISGGTCSSGGSLSDATSNNTCTINTQFGPAANGVSSGSKTATFNVSYTPYVGGVTTNTADVSLSGTVTDAPSADITSSVTGNSFASGIGTVGDPFQGFIESDYIISITYTNSSSITGTAFTTDSSSITTPFTLSNHGCNNINLSSGDSCADVYTINSLLINSYTLALSSVTASWQDSSGSYTNITIVGNEDLYIDLLNPPPSITINSTNWSAYMGSAFSFVATISNGSSTITPSITSGISGAILSPSSCTLDSSNVGTESCIFMVTPYLGSTDYSFWSPSTNSNSNNINMPTNIYTGGPITLQVTTTNGALVDGNPSPANINGIVGEVFAPYIYLPQTGQTPTLPINTTSINGADGALYTGIPWAYNGANPTSPDPRFENTDSGCTITDHLTGLVWLKDPSGIAADNWSNVLTTANNGTWCSKASGSWRMPNINELSSLVNYAKTSQATWLNTVIGSGGAGFSNLSSSTAYWASTTSPTTTTAAFGVQFSNGSSATITKTQSRLLLPVRDGN